MNEFEALALAAAAKKKRGPRTPNPDGTFGKVPEGIVFNPKTGQMEDLRSPANPNIPTGVLAAAALGAGQGLGFGGLDEVAGGIRGAFGGDANLERERIREAERRAREDHPAAFFGGLIPGAVASSVSGGRALGINPFGANAVSTGIRGAGIGATEGAIFGFLDGSGGATNRAKSAASNAALGGVVGAAAPAVVGIGGKVARAGSDLIGGGFDAVTGRANQNRAGRAILDTVRKSGRSVDDIADDVSRAAQEGQPEFRLMDATGKAGQRRASGIARAGGDGSEELSQFLEQRQLGQADRVVNFADDAFGTGGTTAEQTKRSLNEARKATNNVNFNAARADAGPVNLNKTIDIIDTLSKRDPIIGETALSKTEIGKRLSSLRNKMTTGDEQLIDFDTVLNIKDDLGKIIGRIKKSGDEVPFELSQVFGGLNDALEKSSDAFRAANTAALNGRKAIQAVDDGAQIATRGRPDDTIPAFQALTPDQQNAARIGFGDKLIEGVQRNKASLGDSSRVFRSPKTAAESQALALDPQLLANRLGREQTMFETQNRALRGSLTADNLQDVANTGALADVGRAAKSAFSGNFGNALGTIGARGAAAASGQNEATRALIAKMLLSDNPRQTLSTALRQETTSAGRQRVIEAITRALGREFLPTQ